MRYFAFPKEKTQSSGFPGMHRDVAPALDPNRLKTGLKMRIVHTKPAADKQECHHAGARMGAAFDYWCGF